MKMIIPVSTVLPVLLLCVSSGTGQERPRIFGNCKGAPRETLESCIVTSIHKHKDTIANGVPEVNLPALEPLEVDDVMFTEKGGNSVINGHFSKIKVHGSKDFEITRLDIDYPNMRVDFEVTIPQLKITGRHILDGNILVVPLTGNGTFWILLDDVKINVHILMEIKDIEGSERLQINFEKLDFQTEEIRLRINGAFGGDQAFGETLNVVVNQNARDILEIIRPRITSVISTRGQAISNNLLANVELENLSGSEFMPSFNASSTQ